MNWRRGFLRLWLVASFVWAAVVGLIIYERNAIAVERAAAQKACLEEAEKANPGNPFNPYGCLKGGMEFEDLTPLSVRLQQYAWMTFPPIFGSLLGGLALFWIAAGFKGRNLSKRQ